MKNKKRGVTLIEVVVALAAFMIVMLAITSILITTINYTGINKKTFNSNAISRTFFEAMKESRIGMPMNGATPPVPKPNKLTSGLSEVSYVAGFDNEYQARSFVIDTLLKDTAARPGIVGNPADFSSCKQVGKTYSMGIKMKWTCLDVAHGISTHIEKGVYEIETWCWDTNKGESSLVNRKTFLAPK